MTPSRQKLPFSQQALVEDSTGQPVLVRDTALLPGTVLVKAVAVALTPSDTRGSAPTRRQDAQGGRYACLELCPEELRTRKAVKAGFIMVLVTFGERVQLRRGYEREPDSERNAAAVCWFEMLQRFF
ncbi:hypothetical protein GGR52DRAFT_575630 [Hypoxylon sp. FL1284]|nr:hypothetical protein GGR52DRAFT_575630 [Hypoxylon sp. FL1284]